MSLPKVRRGTALGLDANLSAVVLLDENDVVYDQHETHGRRVVEPRSQRFLPLKFSALKLTAENMDSI